MATLLEGSVKVEFNNLLSNIILKPNEQLVYDKHTKAHNLRMPEMKIISQVVGNVNYVIKGNKCYVTSKE